MKIIIDSPEKIAEQAALRYAELLKKKPDAVLGYATGSTPLGLYGELAKLNKEGKISFKDAVTFNLDEYVHLDVNDKNSYHSFMHDNLFNYINIPEENINFLDGNAEDLEAECKAYEKRIKKSGGIDIQLLGIGSNGHIAFN